MVVVVGGEGALSGVRPLLYSFGARGSDNIPNWFCGVLSEFLVVAANWEAWVFTALGGVWSFLARTDS